MKRAHADRPVEVFTRAGCGACAALKAALAAADIPYYEIDAAHFEGAALAAWYDLPEFLPQVAVCGKVLDIDIETTTRPEEIVARVRRERLAEARA